jgi:hypothetical protein
MKSPCSPLGVNKVENFSFTWELKFIPDGKLYPQGITHIVKNWPQLNMTPGVNFVPLE